MFFSKTSKPCLVVMMIFIVVFIVQTSVTTSQDSSGNGQPVFPNDAFLLWNGSSLIQWQPTVSVQKSYLNLTELEMNRQENVSTPKQNLGTLSIALDRTNQYIYTLEVISKDERGLPYALQIVQTNILTQNQKSLLTKVGLFTFLMSPNNDKILALYFDGEFGRSGQHACVLTLVSGTCNELNLPLAPKVMQWIDNQTFVVLSLKRQLYLVNSSTLEMTLLPIPDTWDIVSAVPIPGTNSLLLSVNPKNYVTAPVQFLKFDLSTMRLTDFPYDALNSDYTSVQDWWFSPDGQYLLYGAGGSFGMVLVEFKTGQLITELKNVYSPVWFPDSKGVMLLYRTADQSSVIKFDLQTKQSSTLIANAANIVVLH